MKKIIGLLLILIFAIVFITTALAEQSDYVTMPEESQPASVIDDMYDEGTPYNPPEEDTSTIEFDDESAPMGGLPQGETLAQTGGIPSEVFYVIGGICILSAVLLISKKPKANE